MSKPVNEHITIIIQKDMFGNVTNYHMDVSDGMKPHEIVGHIETIKQKFLQQPVLKENLNQSNLKKRNG